MAVLFMDSCQHYATADVLLKWTAHATASIVAAQGRSGDKALYMPGAISYWAQKTLPANKTTLIVGCAVKPGAFGGEYSIIETHDAGVRQLVVATMTDGSLRVRRSNGSVILGTSTAGLVATGAYQYVEVKVVHATTATGSVVVRVNGQVVINVSSVQTAAGNAWANQVRFCGQQSGAYYNDIYIADDQGGVNDDFLGDVACLCLVPNADGHTTQWTPNAGTAHYDRVNQVTNDNDTTYVSSATVDQIDTVALPDLPASVSTVKAVQWHGTLRKDDATTRKVKPVISDGSADQLGTEISLTGSYVGYQNPFDVNPLDSNNPWTPAAVNGLQAGVKVTA